MSTAIAKVSTTNLSTKLVAAMKAIDAVEKTGYNENKNYKYQKATDVAREVRKVLVDLGIEFDFSLTKEEHFTVPTHSGGVMFIAKIEADITWTDSETGESKTNHMPGWGSDTGDKAIYKAITGCLKYAMRAKFLIPDELDPENDKEGESEPRADLQRKSQKEDEPPTFDEYGEPVIQRQPVPKKPEFIRPPAKPANGGATVGIPRGKRFFAIAMGAGRSKQEINDYLGTIGCEKSEEIPVKQYEEACSWAAGQ